MYFRFESFFYNRVGKKVGSNENTNGNYFNIYTTLGNFS